MKEREIFCFFFELLFFCENERAFFCLSKAQRRKTLTLRKTRKIKALHMTARITYKRRYGFRCSRFFFAHIFARRGKRWRGRERVSERFSFARARVMCVYVRMRKFYARFSPSLLF